MKKQTKYMNVLVEDQSLVGNPTTAIGVYETIEEAEKQMKICQKKWGKKYGHQYHIQTLPIGYSFKGGY